MGYLFLSNPTTLSTHHGKNHRLHKKHTERPMQQQDPRQTVDGVPTEMHNDFIDDVNEYALDLQRSLGGHKGQYIALANYLIGPGYRVLTARLEEFFHAHPEAAELMGHFLKRVCGAHNCDSEDCTYIFPHFSSSEKKERLSEGEAVFCEGEGALWAKVLNISWAIRELIFFSDINKRCHVLGFKTESFFAVPEKGGIHLLPSYGEHTIRNKNVAFVFPLHDKALDHIQRIQDNKRGVFLSLVKALGKLHMCGYAHCDVKIDNLLLTKDDDVLLCDFGLATPLSSKHKQYLPILVSENDGIIPGVVTPTHHGPWILELINGCNGQREQVNLCVLDAFAASVVIISLVLEREVPQLLYMSEETHEDFGVQLFFRDLYACREAIASGIASELRQHRCPAMATLWETWAVIPADPRVITLDMLTRAIESDFD